MRTLATPLRNLHASPFEDPEATRVQRSLNVHTDHASPINVPNALLGRRPTINLSSSYAPEEHHDPRHDIRRRNNF